MSKMTETIKKVQVAAEAVLDRAINPEEVIQAIEAIEVLVGAVPTPQQQAISTMAETIAVINQKAAVITQSKTKRKRKYSKRVNWKNHTEWLDMVLNGGTHIISTSYIKELMTSRDQITAKLRKESKARGFRTVHIYWSKDSTRVTIQAVK